MEANVDSYLRLIHLIQDRSGFWDEVHWRHSRRYRHHGYTIVELPCDVPLCCDCGVTSFFHDKFGDITGFEAVVDDRSVSNVNGLNVIVYEKDGRVRHERCGQTLVWLISWFLRDVDHEKYVFS